MRNLSSAKQTGAESRSFRANLLITVLAFSLFALSCSQPQDSGLSGSQSPAASPPQVTQIDDAKLKELLKPNGKPLLVNFWATWCGPCREEFPDLVTIDNEYRGKIDFITISLDFVEEIDTAVPQFLSEMNAAMPTYVLISADENAVISSIAKDWSGALPFTILYRDNGEVAFLRQGKVNHEILEAEIEKIVDK